MTRGAQRGDTSVIVVVEFVLAATAYASPFQTEPRNAGVLAGWSAVVSTAGQRPADQPPGRRRSSAPAWDELQIPNAPPSFAAILAKE
jgi:hypothetical protein